jgi:enoyl-CoA hydratase/carnithine racemase
VSTESELLVDRVDAALHVTFNRPHTLNALTTRLLNAAAVVIEAAGDDPGVRVVVMTGAGRAFSSGADLSSRNDPDYTGGQDTVDAVNRLVRAVRAVPKPVVAAVNGPAVGGACSVALAADFTVAAESAYFLLPFANLGLMPDAGATALVPAAIGLPRAARMAMLAERIPAPVAAEWGLVAQATPDADFHSEVRRLTERLANGPTSAYAQIKAALNATALALLEQALEIERGAHSELTRTADYAEGIAAFLQKRGPRFSGS